MSSWGKKKWLAISVLVAGIVGYCVDATAADQGVLQSNSRRPYTHRITLYNEEGRAIDPAAKDPGIFSMTGTCSKCHDVSTISEGWHFNAVDPEVDPGRPGEPWILTDERTKTQLPISYRGWKGTWNPDKIGLTRAEFVKAFGRHMPGGGAGIPAEAELEDENSPWHTTGAFEVDCNACHTRDHSYDPAQRATQIDKGNFEYVSIATMGLGLVRGSVEEAAANTTDDPLAMFDPALEDAAPGAVTLEVEYAKNLFDADDRVFFGLSSNAGSENCYQCHSTHVNEPAWAADAHQTDMDVHLAAGLSCADCHRNGIDHKIVRGYEGESLNDVFRTTLSCQGCHYGVGEDPNATRGRLGSPFPDHEGIPPIHFETMACTACHSGPMPEGKPQIVETSMAHALGIAEFLTGARRLPYIQQPVYMPGHDDKLAPHRILWPSYWAIKDAAGSISPMLPEQVIEITGSALPGEKDEAVFDQSTISKGLGEIAKTLGQGETAVYIAAGKAYTVDNGGNLSAEIDPSAEPYAWPIGHDVRPAGRSIGASSCQECHSPDADFMFGEVAVLPPWQDENPVTVSMTTLSGLDEAYHKNFANGFKYRSAFKILGFVSGGFILLILLAFMVKACLYISSRIGGTQQ